jgi:chloramphenicol-sensitive protein RarD
MSGTPGVTPTGSEAHASHRLGLIYGASAYILWGFFPLYFALLLPASPVEILSERFVFSLIFMAAVLTVTRSWSALAPVVRHPRQMLLVCCAAVLIAVNWGTYIWAVDNGNVVEASLGYFINPLVLVVIGVVLLGERLRPLQWSAVGIATLAVAVLTFGYGKLPWIALVLAFSFAGYGLIKKVNAIDPRASLTLETAVASPFALVYLIVLQTSGTLVLFHQSAATTLLLMGTGVITAVPLLMFGAAANRIPLSTMGLLQYLTPMIQFVIGVWVVDEPMPPARWAGFAIVWVALAVFSYDGLRQGSRTRTARRAAAQDASGVEAPI